jgi:raffinose/stachyose/melibiose transport system permease protein
VEADRSAMEDGRDPAKYAGGSGLRRRRLLTAWLFMVPLLVINVLVILGPSVATIYYSLTEWAGIGPADFVGLQNYRDLLADGDFWMAMWHNVIWTVLFLTVPIFMGLLGRSCSRR